MASEETDEVFHPGECDVQTRAGRRERIAQVGPHLIRDFMPEQHQELFAQLPMLLVGSLDADGRPWASVLVGRPGFVHALDPQQLRITARPVPGDPLAAALRVDASLGLLGIELETRRRNRMNGRVVAVDDSGFVVRAQQSFGNCPKYIQARAPHWIAEPATFVAPRPPHQEAAALSAEARAIIERADTFFIATATAHAAEPGRARSEGVDVSHRGGRPGFVRLDDESGTTVLTVPDFTGNFLFNTLGNLVVNPRAGLLVIDFTSGDLLSLTGTVEIVWDGREVKSFAGADRLWRFRPERGWRVAGVMPLRWSDPELSPHLADLGPWHRT